MVERTFESGRCGMGVCYENRILQLGQKVCYFNNIIKNKFREIDTVSVQVEFINSVIDSALIKLSKKSPIAPFYTVYLSSFH